MQPIKPQDRDPNLVMIGLPSIGEGLWDLVRNMISLETLPNPFGYKFVVRRCRDAGGIGKARNMLTHVARCLGASKMILVDKDILATAEHFFKLLNHGPEIKLIGALYPLRITPLCWVGEFLPATTKTIGSAGEWPMEHVGTGLIRVDLSVFDELIESGRVEWYEHEDVDPQGSIPYGTKIHDFWAMGPRKGQWFGTKESPAARVFQRYVTEDYMMSYNYRSIGGRCWVDGECQVGHVGKVDFLDLEAAIEKRVDAALAQYKADLKESGFNAPTLVRDTTGKLLGFQKEAKL